MKNITKQDIQLMCFLFVCGMLFYYGISLIGNHKIKQQAKPQVANSAKIDSLLLDAFVNGEQRGVSVAIKEITIYGNNPTSTKMIVLTLKINKNGNKNFNEK